MNQFVDIALVIVILLFLFLIVWSRIMNQRMTDTVLEIKEIVENISFVKDVVDE